MKITVYILFILFLSNLHSDVKSSSGTIKFDSNGDNTSEMVLQSDKLGLGTSNPLSSLEVQGSLGLGYQNVSSNTTLTGNTIVFVDSASDNITLTLPYAANVTGRIYTVKKTSFDNAVYIEGGGNLIDGTSPIIMNASTSSLPNMTVMSSQNEWFIIRSNEIETTVASDNLVGWWKLDETSGSIARDSSENSYDGSLGSGVTFSSNGLAAFKGRGLAFDGTDDNDYIDLGNVVGSSNSLSVSFWAKPSEISYMQPLSKMPTTATGLGWSFKYRNNGDVWWRIGSQSSNNSGTTLGSGVYTIGDWHFMVATFDGSVGTAKIYFNGTLYDTTTGISQGVNDTTVPTRVTKASASSTSEEFGGVLDDIRIFDRVLTLTEIQVLYQEGNP